MKVKTISYSHFLSSYIGQQIGKKILRNFLGQGFYNHQLRKSSEVINIFSFHLTRSVSFIVYFLEFLVAFVSCIFLITFIIFKNPLITLGTFVCVVSAYIYIAKNYKTKIVRDGEIQKKSLDRVTNLVQEITRNIENTIINYRDQNLISSFNLFDRSQREASARIRNYNILPKYIIEGVGLSSFAFLTVIYAYISRSSEIDNLKLIGTLGTLVFGMQKLLPSVNTIYQSWSSMNACVPSVFAVKGLLLESSDKNRISESINKPKNFKKNIQLKEIYFGYSNKEFIFNNLTINIKKEDKILIKGNSGSGKSTLIRIIMSLIFPLKGNILIDDLELGKDFPLSDWRRQIGYVKQKPFLKSGRIIDLIMGEKISHENIKMALTKAEKFAKIVCIDEFIKTLPSQYFTFLQEDGNILSGGQIQRISIAASLASNPSLLILDESTSGLEKEIESEIFMNLLNMKNLTLIAISHSKNVDAIFQRKIKL